MTEEPVFVANMSLDGRRNPHPASAYCSLSPDGRQVNLILGPSPLPVDRDVEYGIVPYFVRVLEKQQVAGTLRFDVPLQEWNGYSQPRRDAADVLVDVRRVVLQVETIPESQVRRTRPAEHAAEHWYVVGIGSTQALALDLDEPLLVWRRNDEFPRP